MVSFSSHLLLSFPQLVSNYCEVSRSYGKAAMISCESYHYPWNSVLLGTEELQWRGKKPSNQCHPSLLQFIWKHNTGGWNIDGASSSWEGSGFAQGNRDYS